MTTEVTPNLAELDAIIAHAKAHPESHYQGDWATYAGTASELPPVVTPELTCGSAFCIAGAAVARAGGQMLWRYNGIQWVATHAILNRVTYSISRLAQSVLGLNEYQADKLFSGSNSMADIDEVRDRIAKGDNFSDDYPYPDGDDDL